MSSTIKLQVTDGLRAFVDRSSGDGTCFITPGDFVRDLLRAEKDRQEAALLRDAIREGYRDVIAGRVVEYRGDLRGLMRSGD